MTFPKNITKQLLLDIDPYSNINSSVNETEKIV